MKNQLEKTERTQLRRSHKRGAFDRKTIYAILDAQPQCTIEYVIDGKPYVTPTLQWRIGDRVFWHGSSASRAINASAGCEVCLTVFIFDGFVMARSGFHHSVNFRSVMLFGVAERVSDEEKQQTLYQLIEKFWPGRTAHLRKDRPSELKATTLLSMRITEGSAKIRSGAPVDDEEDYTLPIWAGVIPVITSTGTPQPDPRNLPEVDMPDHIQNFQWKT